MNRTHVWRPLLPALLTLVAGGTATAQKPPAPQPTANLDSLLSQLKQTDGKAWQARKDAMANAAKQARAESAKLRGSAKQKDAAAKAETQKAEKLNAELQKLANVRKTLGELTFVDKSKKETEPGKLQTALTALAKLPAAAWDARTNAMQAEAKKHAGAAARLSKEGKSLIAQATKQDGKAKSLDAELQKLMQLQKLVATLDGATLAPAIPAVAAVKPAKQPAGKPMAKAAPAKAPAKKAPAKKAPAKKAPTKNTPAKKPAPKKAAAKKAAANVPAKMPAAKMPAAKAPAKLPEVKVEADKDLVTFEDHVFPIFDEYCASCHEPGDPSGGLDLTSHAATLQGGSSGRTLAPGDPDQSRLYLLVSHKEKPTMPPKEDRIADDLIKKIHTWIKQGAPKDLKHAKKLAVERAKKRQLALAEAAKRKNSPVAAKVVMPTNLPKVEKAYPKRPGSMRALATSPTAPLLAVPGFRQVLLMHQDNLQELGVLDFPFGQVECLAFSADGSVLIASGGTPGKSGGAILFDVQTGKELGRFGKQRDVVLSAAVSPDGALVAVGGTRRRVIVTRVADDQKLWMEQLEDWATALAFSPDGKLIATGDRQGFVVVREADNGREVHEMKPAVGILTDLAFSPDSSMLAAAGGDRSVTLYRIRDGSQLFQQKRHRDAVLCIAWRTTSRLVTGGADGRVMQWRTNGANEAELPRVKDWVYDIATSKDQKRVFTADWLGRVLAVDVKTRKVIKATTPLAAPKQQAAQTASTEPSQPTQPSNQ